MTICATRTLGSRRSRAGWSSTFSTCGYMTSGITALPCHELCNLLRAEDALLGRLALVEELADGAAHAVHVQAQVGQQLVALGVLDEAVGDAEADDVARVQAGGIGRLQYRAAEAAF